MAVSKWLHSQLFHLPSLSRTKESLQCLYLQGVHTLREFLPD